MSVLVMVRGLVKMKIGDLALLILLADISTVTCDRQ